MKKALKWITIGLFLVLRVHSHAAGKVLLIGNSYANGTDPYLREFLSNAPEGEQRTLTKISGDGYGFIDHYNTASTLATITNTDWEVIILQGHSTGASTAWWYYEEYAEPGESFVDYVGAPYPSWVSISFWDGGTALSSYIASNTTARIVYFNTWARHRDDSNYLPILGPAGDGQAQAERMQDYTTGAYGALAAEFPGSRVAPVGEAWRRSYQNSPDFRLHLSDHSHAKPRGYYLAAAVLYNAITGELPTQNDYDGGLNAETARQMKEIADTLDSSLPPVISKLTPDNNASNTPLNTPLVATFSEPVQAGTGSITLKKRSDDSTVETFDVTDPSVAHFDGTQLRLVPSNHLKLATDYYVEIPDAAVQDLSAAPFAGFSGNSHWSFSTIASNAIVLVNSASKVVASTLSNSSTSFAFDANADMIIVAVSTERSSGNIAVRYDGHTLNNAVDAQQAGIWYLDLTETAYVGGSANLEIDFTDVDTVNGVGVGVVSVSASGAGIDLHATETGTSNLVLSTSRNGTFNVVSFNANSSGNPSVAAPLTKIYANGNIGSAQGAAGYQANVPAGEHSYSWTATDKRKVAAAAFALRGQFFSTWLEQYDLGALTNLGDDPDGDGAPNGIEAWFGSHPGEFSSGLIALNVSGSQISLIHPQSDPPPTDLQLSYRWSVNLADWYDCDGTDGPLGGGTVSVSSETADGTATVTVTPSDEMDRLFLRPMIQQN